MKFFFTPQKNNSYIDLNRGMIVLDWAEIKNNTIAPLELVVTIDDSKTIQQESFLLRKFSSSRVETFNQKVDFTKKIENKCWISINSPSTINFSFKGMQSHLIELAVFVIR
jgi:hypothetical protein